MILTWIGDVRPLLEESCYQKYWRQLPHFRQKKAEKCCFPMGRALSVGVWILWQQAKETYQLSKETVFNLSHSGYYALCSAQIPPDGRIFQQTQKQIQVGCDVQRISDYREKIARRFFCPEEYSRIQKQENPADKEQMFFRYWVLKESFIKATRRGMAMELDSFSFMVKEGKYPVLERCPTPYQKEDYFFREFALESYRAAVCSTDPEIEETLYWVNF